MKGKTLLLVFLFATAICQAQTPSINSDSLTLGAYHANSGTSAGIMQAVTVIGSILGSLIVALTIAQFVLKRIPTQESVKIQGVLGSVLDFLTAFQKDVTALSGIPKVLFVLVMCALFALPSTAQGIFKIQPRLARPAESTVSSLPFARDVVQVPTDSIVTAWRLVLDVTPAGFTADGMYHLGVGSALSYQVQDYNYALQKYTVKHSYNFVWVPLVTGKSITSIKDFEMIGVTYGWNNNLLQVGPFFYPGGTRLKNQVGVMFIVGLNFNNN